MAAVDSAKDPVATAGGNSLCRTPGLQFVRQPGAMNRAPTSLTASICFRSWRPLVSNGG